MRRSWVVSALALVLVALLPLASASARPLGTVVTLRPDDTSGKDTWLSQDGPTANDGAGSTMDAIKTGGSTFRRILVEFDLSSIPVDAVIVSADLELTARISYTGVDVGVYRITAPWLEDQATWNIASTGNPWSSAGGDYQSGAVTVVNPGSVTDGSLVVFDVTSLVQSWVDGSVSNYGFLLKLTDEAASAPDRGLPSHSSGASTSGYRPALVVDYVVPSSTPTATSTNTPVPSNTPGGPTDTPTPTLMPTSTGTAAPMATVTPSPTWAVGVSGDEFLYYVYAWRGTDLFWAFGIGMTIVSFLVGLVLVSVGRK